MDEMQVEQPSCIGMKIQESQDYFLLEESTFYLSTYHSIPEGNCTSDFYLPVLTICIYFLNDL